MDLLKTVKEVYRIIEDKIGEDITVIDVSEFTAITSYMVFCSGQTAKHTKAICDEIHWKLKKHKTKLYPLGIEGYPDTGWVLMDYGDFMVHIFTREMREYYRLEKLWGQGKEVKLNI